MKRALNTAIGGNTNSVYLIVGDLGSELGEGLDFINGLTFLERFYSVFVRVFLAVWQRDLSCPQDTTQKRVGLATTEFTHATTN